MADNELGVLITAIIALAAGFMRGFTGFGGPSFMLAILTIFYSPIETFSKVLVIDFFASIYLFSTVAKND